MNRALFVSNLFPSVAEPIRGLDNAVLLHTLREDWKIRVLSPRAALIPLLFRKPEARGEDCCFEPEYVPSPYVPKLGSRWNDQLMEAWMESVFKKLIHEFRPDVILCSWLFPDGCAVARLAERHRIPVVLVTQGTDTHTYLEDPQRRKKILRAVDQCSAVICRSGDLASRLESAGANPSNLHVIYNGVDTDTFCVRERDEARESLGIEHSAPILLFVGNYLPVKNPLFLISMLRELNRRRESSGDVPVHLVFIGDGPLRSALENEAAAMGLSEHVTILSRKPAEEIALWMAAADVFCLSSHNEGFPNVLLEAMACELPVVSTDVGGISELIDRRSLGVLLPPGDLAAFVDSVTEVLTGRGVSERRTSQERDASWAAAGAAYSKVMDLALEKWGKACPSQV